MVKINFKTVQNKLFAVDAEDTETIGDIKKKIQESQTFPAENQKLIYSGKILNDTATVGSLKIKEKDFLVVMVSKPKAQPAAAAAASSSASTSTPAPAPATTTAPTTTETPAATSIPAASTDSAPAVAAAGSSEPAPEAAQQSQGIMGGSFVTGSALQSAIEGMVEMGFPRDQVQKALRASFNNPDRAVEYLMSGNIPEVEGAARPPTQAAAPPAAAAPAAAAPAPAPAPAAAPAPPAAASAPSSGGGSADNLFAAAEAAMQRDRGMPAAGTGAGPGAAAALGGAGGAAGAGGAGPLGGLANSPYIQQLREMVQQNPALIQPLLQQIATQNPQLAQLINQNPQVLYELLGAGAEGEGDDEDFGGPQVMQVDLTEQEAAAVERLEALGFDRQMVLQAYMLCDKNEELAANFLFDSGDDEMA